MELKEYDVVRLRRAHETLPAGALGTVLVVHGRGAFEVEFCDALGRSLAVSTMHQSLLEFVSRP